METKFAYQRRDVDEMCSFSKSDFSGNLWGKRFRSAIRVLSRVCLSWIMISEKGNRQQRMDGYIQAMILLVLVTLEYWTRMFLWTIYIQQSEDNRIGIPFSIHRVVHTVDKKWVCCWWYIEAMLFAHESCRFVTRTTISKFIFLNFHLK